MSGARADLLREIVRAPTVELSASERRAYQLGAAMLDMHHDAEKSGLAWEVSETLRQALPLGATYRGGLLVPHSLPDVQLRAGLDSKTSTRGTELVFQQPGPLIEALRKKAVVLRLGATELAGLTGNVKLPRLTGVTTASWSAENPGSDVSDTSVTLDQAPLTPRELIGTTSYSRQLLIQSMVSTGVDKLVRGDLALSHAVAIDAGAIAGTGTNQPTGITNTAGVSVVALGTNGAQVVWANVTALESAVANANADVEPETIAYLTTPVLRNSLRNKDRSGGTTSGLFIINDGQDINSYPIAVSNNVPSTLTKGTAIGICHALIYGRFAELLLGFWGAFEVVVDPFRLKKQGMIEVTSYELCDVTLRHPTSFAVILDALQ